MIIKYEFFINMEKHLFIKIGALFKECDNHAYEISFYSFLGYIVMCLIVCNELSIHDYNTSLTSYR